MKELLKSLKNFMQRLQDTTHPVDIELAMQYEASIDQALAELEKQPKPVIFECKKCRRFYDKEMICPYCKDTVTRSAESRDIIDRQAEKNDQLTSRCGELGVERDVAIGEQGLIETENKRQKEIIMIDVKVFDMIRDEYSQCKDLQAKLNHRNEQVDKLLS